MSHHRSLRSLLVVALATLSLAGCSSSSPPPPPVEPYLYTPPPAAAPSAGLAPETWTTHHRDDLLPFWTTNEAFGVPVGNFPTWRGMDGSLAANTARKPRMMGRQIYAYAMGFMLTGDEALLDHARAGNRWLLDHARDTSNGGWHADLDLAGAPVGAGARWSQDLDYDAMGPAAFFFVTRDAESEAAVLAARDALFDPARFWDAAGGRIKDGLDATMTTERWMGATGSWQLVAQLDPITAFELLVQPVLTDPARRTQALGDLRTLATLLRTTFWRDGIFWGSTGDIGVYGSGHTDYGHILKAYWALLLIDKRLDDRPFAGFLATNAPATLTRAWDAPNGRWAKLPITSVANRYGSDWWAYAEADQLAATLALHDPGWIAKVEQSSTNFRADYVDRTRPVRELVSSVSQTGAWVYPWPDADTSKCNDWKNGFHSTEHALVMFLFSHYLAGTPAPLYFAFLPAELDAQARASRPYTFQGRYVSHEDLGEIASDPAPVKRHKVRVLFDQLR
jgi:N-acylglucosamine 2-epimerase (GlcNAc 2-epimerase)